MAEIEHAVVTAFKWKEKGGGSTEPIRWLVEWAQKNERSIHSGERMTATAADLSTETQWAAMGCVMPVLELVTGTDHSSPVHSRSPHRIRRRFRGTR